MDGYCRKFQTSLAQMWTKMWTINAHYHLKYNAIKDLWDFCGGAVRQIGSSIWSIIVVSFQVTRLHTPYPSLFYLTCKLRAKPMPPISNEFIANIYATFMKKVFHVSEWKWKPHVQHYRKLDDLGAGFEIAKGYRIRHSWAAKSRIDVRQVYSDRALLEKTNTAGRI